MTFAGAGRRLFLTIGLWIPAALAPIPAFALGDTMQLLSGGGTFADPGTGFTSPGLVYVYGPNDFGTNKGERAAQLVMPAGILSALRVRVLTQQNPSSGALTVTVRLNGADTPLTCSTVGTATCHTPPGASANVSNNARLSVKIANTFVGAGNLSFTYSFLFD